MSDETPANIYRLDLGDGEWLALWWQYAPRRVIRATLWCAGLGIVAILFTYPQLSTPAVMCIGPIVLAVVGSSVVFNLVSYRKNLPRLRAYELQLDPDQVLQRIPGVPELAIRREEVTRLVESPRYGLIIHTADPKRRIGILPQMQGYAAIRDQLADWLPIQPPGKLSMFYLSRDTVRLTVFLVAYMATLFGQTPIVVLPGAIVTLGILGYSMANFLRQGKKSPKDVVLSAGVYLIFGCGVLFGVIRLLQ